MPNIPITKVRTSHALTIRSAGITIGLINGWDASQGRTITPIFEIDINDSGNPVENAPGNVSGLTVQISRYDAYKSRMEQVFGTPDLIMLTRQNQPFEVVELWKYFISSGLVEERYIYKGCWFNNLGRSIRADNNRIVNVNATLTYVKKIKVTGLLKNISELSEDIQRSISNIGI